MAILSPTVITRRLRRIGGVLRRYGLLRRFWWLRGRRGVDLTAESASRWREAFQELGPTFVKFGQLLSLRADLFPPEVTAELEKLQDQIPLFPADVARSEVERELGGPLENFFSAFDTQPLAAASIAQVHGARLREGQEVVVKIQRPGIRQSIDSDLTILKALAALIERAVTEARIHAPHAIVEEFQRVILRELDFRAEARNMERFGRHFAGSEEVCIPRVYWELTGPKILVAERCEGRRITDVQGVSAEERARLARAVNGCYLTQAFDFGLFHADPHPGNLIVLPDGRLGFHDFGIVGRLSTAARRALAELFHGVIERDPDRVLEVYLRLGAVGGDVPREALRDDIEELLDEFAGLPLEEFSVGEVLEKMVRLARQYRIHFPTNFFLLGKTIIMVESLTRTLDPSYEATALLRERAATLGTMSLRNLAADALRVARGSEEVLEAIPGALGALARKMREGSFGLRLRHERLEDLEDRLDRSFNRLTFGVVVAAIIVGSSIIMQTSLPPNIFGVPVLGVLGYLAAAVMGFGLLVAIIRRGRL